MTGIHGPGASLLPVFAVGLVVLGACSGGSSVKGLGGAGGADASAGSGGGGAAGAALDVAVGDRPVTSDDTGVTSEDTGSAGTDAAAAQDGAAGDTDAPSQPSASVDVVLKGPGCGKGLPADQPRTVPGEATGYKKYKVTQTGRTLGLPDPFKAIDRTFWVRVPADYDPQRAYRVVYVGQGCGALGMANVSALPLYSEALGGSEQAIYVAIDLPGNDPAYPCYDQRSGATSMEWEAFELLHEVVDANYCVDNNRVFVAGTASGGVLANMWGCYFAGTPDPPRKFAPRYRIRGQAAIAAGEAPAQPPCNGPVAGLWFNPPYSDTGTVVSAAPARDRVLRQNGCPSSTTARWPAMPNLCVQYTDCPKEHPVVFCNAPGPGAQPDTSVQAFRAFFDMVSSGIAPTKALPGFEAICLEGETASCAVIGYPGRCAAGTTTCKDARWGFCSILPADADTCAPGNDDTCDGRPYTGCGCRWTLPAVGVSAPARFDTSVAGVVSDSATGLMWRASQNPPTREAFGVCDGTYNGFADWRVPTLPELMSIVDYTATGVAIDPAVFPGTPPGLVWTSTEVRTGGRSDWYVDFGLGVPAKFIDVLPDAGTRCVRIPVTGQPSCFPDEQRFVIANGLVQDKTTGLTWRRDVTATLGWNAALAACAALGGGFRAPTVRELMSLVDYGGNVPTVNYTAFPDVFSERRLWTSTPRAGAPALAWTVDFNDGTALIEEKATARRATRCVR